MSLSNKTTKTQVLYDDQCAFCCYWKKVLSKKDKKDKTEWLALKNSQNILEKYSVPANINSIVLISKNKVFYKSDAVIEILLIVELKWAIIFKIFPKSFRDIIYSTIARNRNIFQ